jgi:hypothetical protein
MQKQSRNTLDNVPALFLLSPMPTTLSLSPPAMPVASAPGDRIAGGDFSASPALADRFVAWRGGCGRRFVCSVFPASAPPDYAGAVVLGVAGRGAGRRLVSIATSDAAGTLQPWLATGEAEDEVHVHLLATSPSARAQAVASLAAVMAATDR